MCIVPAVSTFFDVVDNPVFCVIKPIGSPDNVHLFVYIIQAPVSIKMISPA